jgi:glycosyltransferase involved in cell wall biosynthesis
MKIAIIQPVIARAGGNEVVLVSLLKALKRTNHLVNVYSLDNKMKQKISYNIENSVSLFPFKTPLFGLYQQLFQINLANKIKKENLVISLSGTFLSFPKKKSSAIFYIQNKVDDLFNWNQKYEKGFWKLYYLLFKLISNHTRKRFIESDKIKFLVVSNYIKNTFEEFTKKSCEVLYPPVDLNEFKNNNFDKKGIITICRYSPEKNIEFIIRVLEKINVEPKIIFGSLDPTKINYFNKLKDLAKNQNIDLVVNKPRSELKKYLENSKIYFHAGNETFGISVVEAISAGCIPIVPDSTSNKETVSFPELRYDYLDEIQARQKVFDALEGKFESLKNDLLESIQKFDEKVFQDKFLKIIQSFERVNVV